MSKFSNILHKSKLLLLVISSLLLTACIGSSLLTGANLIYDRHNLYKKGSDFQLTASASRALYKDNTFKRKDCSIDLAIFNGDILLAGHVPTEALRQEALRRMQTLSKYRRLFNQLAVGQTQNNDMQDNWITTKIRSEMIADSAIDPHDFKVITSDQIVYLMGDVIPEQATRVIRIARKCAGVKRVVKLLKYYNLSDKPQSKQG